MALNPPPRPRAKQPATPGGGISPKAARSGVKIPAAASPATPASRKPKERPSKKLVLRTARFRLMPLTMTMLGLIFVAKMSDVYQNMHQLHELLSVRDAKASDAPDSSSDKPADAKADDKKPDDADKKSDDAKADDKKSADKKDAKPADEPKTLGAGKTTIKAIEALKARENQQQFTQTELDLLQNLVKRREELEKREEELQVKSTVLDATEKRINDKIEEMKILQAQLSSVVEQYNKHQDAEIRGLVKVYENMKPADAANIFNQLDMQILLEVIDKMSEKKVAPVLAAMDTKRAREVTLELAELRRGRVAMKQAADAAVASAAAQAVAAPAPAATAAPAAPAATAPATPAASTPPAANAAPAAPAAASGSTAPAAAPASPAAAQPAKP